MIERPARSAAALAAQVTGGNSRAAARLMRLVDDGDATGLDALAEVYVGSAPARLVGITGSPGVGKSSLIDRLIAAFRARGERVGVVAVDPTSPYSGGAILGDRVRMQGHVLDDGVFVRSLANRGQLGGLSASVPATIAVMEGMGFDRVIIETVGIGQSEVDVARVAESTVVVLAPGLGDDIQAMKAGLLEVADIHVVNKSDRPGAERTAHDLEMVLQLRGEDEDAWTPPVVMASALEGGGIDAIVAAVEQHRQHLDDTGGLDARRRARARLEVETLLVSELRQRLLGVVGGQGALDAVVDRVAGRRAHPRMECARLLGGVVPGRRSF